MPLYEAVVIATHYNQYAPLRNLLSSTASFIRSQGGCVRAFNFHGARVLAQDMRKLKADHKPRKNEQGETIMGMKPPPQGDHWTMLFDANPPTLKLVTQRLAADPRVLRHTVLKIGATLPDILKPPQHLEVYRD